MLPSLFSESAVKLPEEQDRRSPSSEADDTTDDSVSGDPIQREGLPEKLQTLKLDTGSSTSGIVTSGADDNASVPSPEGPSADPNYNKNFLERYRHENKWLELKDKPIPSTESERGEWADEWCKAYQEGIRLGIPRFVNDGSRMAILDLMAALKIQNSEYFEISSFNRYTISVEKNDISADLDFEKLIGAVTRLWPEFKDPRSKETKRIEEVRLFHDWNDLKASDIPFTRRGLEAWLDRWITIYHRAVDINMQYFIKNDSTNAKYDFISCFRGRSEWASFFDSCFPIVLSGSPQLSFVDVVGKCQFHWMLEEKLREHCVCGLSNHLTWKECYYVNELLRPEGWFPRAKFMARVEEEARNDPKLRKFIRNHRVKKLPSPPNQEEPKQEEKPKEQEDEEEESQQPIHVLFPILADQALEENEKTKTSFFLLNNTPVHICNDRSRFTVFKQRDPTLPQNKIYSLDSFSPALGIHGVGQVVIKARAPNGEEKAVRFRLMNVQYCPQAPCNAVSIPRLKTKGIYFDGRTNMLCVDREGKWVDIAQVDFRHKRFMLEDNTSIKQRFEVCM